MRRLMIYGSVGLLLLTGLAGCSSQDRVAEPAEVAAAPREQALQLSAPIDISLADLLKQPRAELARRCEEELVKIHNLEQGRHGGQIRFLLAPDVPLPLQLPVLRQAKFVPKLGVSVPPYLAALKSTTALTLHLARYGDREAAQKLLPATDADRLQEPPQRARNYPLEWTRLAALLLHSSSLQLARGEPEAARTIIGLHTQLQTLLDEAVRSGPLGVALLSRGRTVLEKAADYWSKDQTELAQQVREALAKWGTVPAPALPVTFGSPRAEALAVFGGICDSHALRVPQPLLALDVLALPCGEQELDDVVVFFDQEERLTEILILQHQGVENSSLTPEHWQGWRQAESTAAGQEPVLHYRLKDGMCAIQSITKHPAVGALLRLTGDYQGKSLSLPRDFDLVHLNRTFERNRLSLARQQAREKLAVTDPQALKRLSAPLGTLPVQLARLLPHAQFDIVEDFSLQLAWPERRPAVLADVALPLWEQLGRSEKVTLAGKELLLMWGDDRTKCLLMVPETRQQPPHLHVIDHPSIPAQERAAAVRAWDLQERQEHMTAGKGLTFLPRQLENIALGQPQAAAQQQLPRGGHFLHRKLPRGVAVFSSAGVTAEPYQLRELIGRWDESGNIAEVRALYTTAQADQGGVQVLVTELQKQYGIPSQAKQFTASDQSEIIWQRWQDDAASVTMQVEAGSVAVILRDRPVSQPEGAPLPPLELLTRGPEARCQLGMSKADLFRQWQIQTPQLVDGAVQLPLRQDSLHDMLLVWLDNDRVSRIVARHKQTGAALTDPVKAGQAVLSAWGQAMRSFGWPRRQHFQGPALHSCGNADDVTEVQIFWQPQSGQPRLFTEWKRHE